MRKQKPVRTPLFINKQLIQELGVTALYLMNDYGMRNVHDFSERNHTLVLTDGTIWNNRSLVVNSANEYARMVNSDNRIINSDRGTIIVKIKSFQTFNDALDHYILSTTTAGEGFFILTKNSQNRLYFIFQDSVGQHIIRVNSPEVPNWETGTFLAILWDIDNAIAFSDNMVFNIDGKHTPPVAASGETAWNSFTVHTDINILNGILPATYFFDGSMELCYCFNKVLSEAQIVKINDDPYFFTQESLHQNVINIAKGRVHGRSILEGVGRGLLTGVYQ